MFIEKLYLGLPYPVTAQDVIFLRKEKKYISKYSMGSKRH